MTAPFVFPIRAARGPLVERILDRLAAVLCENPSQAVAVLLLAGEHTGNQLTAVVDALDTSQPVRAAILDDVGAEAVVRLGLFDDAFDFRVDFDWALDRLLTWLAERGVVVPAPREVEGEGAPLVFISYRGVDRAFAEQLSSLLQQTGWATYFYQGSERDYGSPSARHEVNSNLQRACGMLVVVCNEWLDSEWCTAEEDLFVQQERPRVYLKLREFRPFYMISQRLMIDVAGLPAEWFPRVQQAIEPWRQRRS